MKHRHRLEAIVRQRHAPQSLVMRARIGLLAGAGVAVRETARELDMRRATVQRWHTSEGQPFAERLCDAARPGTPPTFQPGQIREIVALACESPSASGRPFTYWTLATAASEGGIVERISAHSVGRFLREVDLKPHRARGWINTPRDANFATKCRVVCQNCQLAPGRAAAGIETRSVDETMGVQALERVAPTQPMRFGRPERTELESIRHGITTLIADFDVATGAVDYTASARPAPKRTSPSTWPRSWLQARHKPTGIWSWTTATSIARRRSCAWWGPSASPATSGSKASFDVKSMGTHVGPGVLREYAKETRESSGPGCG
jgi:transposase